ncbi:putative DNA-binding transcriptional regulator YafY [Propionicimonas paludicola]|uniref:Putative DNA-binding transcriptional regulator YafY n=1 Tax=Propionicimonas paludicola TaxID=185243 RepID=A0A2A9CN80_9ACTN|nr:WYL domain-containing protein [Propionicimonas paludicola]PFG15853.1 putative DNA-binding transcriptional regulator YafY [Propionicimonas paludicola]
MAADSSPTARALLVLELLQNRPGTTAAELAEALGVTERAARRYIGILREAEIPVESSRGRYGGYALGRGVRLPPLVFSATEALGVVMAVLEGYHDAADTADPVGNALRKIMRALPEAVAAQAELVRRTARRVQSRRIDPPDPGITAELVAASAARRVVRLDYRIEPDRQWSSEVEPWAVLVREGRWYLLCQRLGSGATRTYRLDRIRKVEVREQTFEPPSDLDPVAELERNFASGYSYPVEVVIEAPIDELTELSRTVGELSSIDESHTRLIATTGDPAYYAEILAGISHPFTVVRGPELAAAVVALGERLVRAGRPTPG